MEDEKCSAEQSGDQAGKPKNAMLGKMLKTTGAMLSKAKDAAVVGGQQIAKATAHGAAMVGGKASELSHQAAQAYDQKVARDAAAKAEQRKAYRLEKEAAFDESQCAALLEQGTSLLGECLGFAGVALDELSKADIDQPLGRESYGLMMLVNVMVPLLEHGLRPEWRQVLPSAALLEGGVWAKNMQYSTQHPAPTTLLMLLAAEKGWKGAAGVDLGVKAVEELADIGSHHRKLQAWYFMSLSNGTLAERLTALLALPDLLEDWLYPWAALRQPDPLTPLVEEISKIDGMTGMISLPIEHLFDHPSGQVGSRAPVQSLAEKMKGGLSVAGKMAAKAGVAAAGAGKAAYVKAGEVAGHVNERVKTYRTQGAIASPSDSPTIRAAEIPADATHESMPVTTNGP